MRMRHVIALIDMDCFYVQVELKEAPQYIGQETAVVQYNSWRGGSIIAVSYEARGKGVNRSMRGDEARQKCPNIHLFRVPESRGKADLTRYRNAGAQVIKCLMRHAARVERASVDEAYIDLTDEVDNLLVAAPDSPELAAFWRSLEGPSITGASACDSHVIGFEGAAWHEHLQSLRHRSELADDLRLAVGAFLVGRMRQDVFESLGFRCSAGVAHSKVVAKYACGLHKPNQQTVVPEERVRDLLRNAPIDKIRGLGGKMGAYIQRVLGVSTMGQLVPFSQEQLEHEFGDKSGSWLYGLCRGHDDEAVLSRQLAQSIGCSKNFPGRQQLATVSSVRHWLGQMSQEVAERIATDCSSNGRLPSHLCVSYRQQHQQVSASASAGVTSSGHEGTHGEAAVSRGNSVSGSRVVPFPGGTSAPPSAKVVCAAALAVLGALNRAGYRDLPEDAWDPPLLSLGLSVGKFRPQLARNDISRFLIDVPRNRFAANHPSRVRVAPGNETGTIPDVAKSTPHGSPEPLLRAPPNRPVLPLATETVGGEAPRKKGFFARLLLEYQIDKRNAIDFVLENQSPINISQSGSKRIKIEDNQFDINNEGKINYREKINKQKKINNLEKIDKKEKMNNKKVTITSNQLKINTFYDDAKRFNNQQKNQSEIDNIKNAKEETALNLTCILDNQSEINHIGENQSEINNTKENQSEIHNKDIEPEIDNFREIDKTGENQSEIDNVPEWNSNGQAASVHSEDQSEYSSIAGDVAISSNEVSDAIRDRQEIPCRTAKQQTTSSTTEKRDNRKKAVFARPESESRPNDRVRDMFAHHHEPGIGAGVVATKDDFMVCEQCSKLVLIWHFPEHADWHLARTVQKQLSQEIIDEEFEVQRDKREAANRNMKLKRKINKISVSTNQMTLDRFFSK